MLVDFDQMPNHSRAWVYQAERSLEEQEVAIVVANLQNFIQEWTAHNAQLKASFKVYLNRFLVLAVDETQHGASGCSIDASVHFIQKLGTTLSVDFFDRQVIFKKEDTLMSAPIKDLKSLIQEGTIQPDTLIFNNSVSSLAVMQEEWQKPAAESWLKRYF